MSDEDEEISITEDIHEDTEAVQEESTDLTNRYVWRIACI